MSLENPQHDTEIALDASREKKTQDAIVEDRFERSGLPEQSKKNDATFDPEAASAGRGTTNDQRPQFNITSELNQSWKRSEDPSFKAAVREQATNLKHELWTSMGADGKKVEEWRPTDQAWEQLPKTPVQQGANTVTRASAPVTTPAAAPVDGRQEMNPDTGAGGIGEGVVSAPSASQGSVWTPDKARFDLEQQRAEAAWRHADVQRNAAVQSNLSSHGGSRSYMGQQGARLQPTDLAPANYDNVSKFATAMQTGGEFTGKLTVADQAALSRDEKGRELLHNYAQQKAAMMETINSKEQELTTGVTSIQELRDRVDKLDLPPMLKGEKNDIVMQMAAKSPAIMASESLDDQTKILGKHVDALRVDTMSRIKADVESFMKPDAIMSKTVEERYANSKRDPNTVKPSERAIYENDKMFVETASRLAPWPSTKAGLKEGVSVEWHQPISRIDKFVPGSAEHTAASKQVLRDTQNMANSIGTLKNPMVAAARSTGPEAEKARSDIMHWVINSAQVLPEEKRQEYIQKAMNWLTPRKDSTELVQHLRDERIIPQRIPREPVVIEASQRIAMKNIGVEAAAMVRSGKFSSLEDAVSSLVTEDSYNDHKKYGADGDELAQSIKVTLQNDSNNSADADGKYVRDTAGEILQKAKDMRDQDKASFIAHIMELGDKEGQAEPFIRAISMGVEPKLLELNNDTGDTNSVHNKAWAIVKSAIAERLDKSGELGTIAARNWDDYIDAFHNYPDKLRAADPKLFDAIDIVGQKIDAIDTKDRTEYKQKLGINVPGGHVIMRDGEKNTIAVPDQSAQLQRMTGVSVDQLKYAVGFNPKFNAISWQDKSSVNNIIDALQSSYNPYGSMAKEEYEAAHTAAIADVAKIQGSIADAGAKNKVSQERRSLLRSEGAPESAVARMLWDKGMELIGKPETEQQAKNLIAASHAAQSSVNKARSVLTGLSVGVNSKVAALGDPAAYGNIVETKNDDTVIARQTRGADVVAQHMEDTARLSGEKSPDRSLLTVASHIKDLNHAINSTKNSITESGIKCELAEKASWWISVANAAPSKRREIIDNAQKRFDGKFLDASDSKGTFLSDLEKASEYTHRSAYDSMVKAMDGGAGGSYDAAMKMFSDGTKNLKGNDDRAYGVNGSRDDGMVVKSVIGGLNNLHTSLMISKHHIPYGATEQFVRGDSSLAMQK